MKYPRRHGNQENHDFKKYGKSFFTTIIFFSKRNTPYIHNELQTQPTAWKLGTIHEFIDIINHINYHTFVTSAILISIFVDRPRQLKFH